MKLKAKQITKKERTKEISTKLTKTKNLTRLRHEQRRQMYDDGDDDHNDDDDDEINEHLTLPPSPLEAQEGSSTTTTPL